jgi:ribosomal protein S18 acetylase RimI-like enzyme
MYALRPARWPADLALLAGLDNSFTTDRIYRVSRAEFGFTVIEEPLGSPLHKAYGSPANIDPPIQEADFAVVAEQAGALVGVVAVKYQAWNRRGEVWHLYVARTARRRGIGMALLKEAEAFARAAGARCLWLETQNVNFPAIQFYRRAGFRLCGLDESLYAPEGLGRAEVALFFARPII